MTLILELPPAAEEGLAVEALRRGTTPAQVATETLGRIFSTGEDSRTPQKSNAALVALLDSFEESDTEAQQREYAELIRLLEEDRTGQRRLFGTGFHP
jgi:hypothetical protein